MAETQATILIPDISGFTEFMTNTELGHGTFAVNMLIQAMVNAVGEEYEVSEIEGDAVLLIKKGSAPSQKEIQDTCLRIFNAFHFQRKWMEQHSVCPCNTCMQIANLTVKFVAHHGPVAELKVGRFVKLSGPEMIVAHRLLKNSILNNEYVLVTEKLLQHGNPAETVEMKWSSASDEYAAIGKIDYRFALLNEERKKVPVPPEPDNKYRTDDTAFTETEIAANYRDVYMVLMNVPGRAEWVTGMQKGGQDESDVYVGSIHHCKFEDFESVVSPMRMAVGHNEILFVESCRIPELNVYVVHEFILKKMEDNTCLFSCRFMNMNDVPLPEKIQASLTDKMQQMANALKQHCEKTETSSFDAALQRTHV